MKRLRGSDLARGSYFGDPWPTMMDIKYCYRLSYIPMIDIFLPAVRSSFIFFYLKTCDMSLYSVM